LTPHDEAQAPNRMPYLHTQEGGRGSGALNSARKRVGFLKRFGRREGYIPFRHYPHNANDRGQKKEIFLKILDLEFIMFILDILEMIVFRELMPESIQKGMNQFVKRLPFDWQC
jgi:hypothetical protein